MNIEKNYIDIQNQLSKKLILKNSFDLNDINNVVGIDLAYFQKQNKEYAVCSAVVVNYHTKDVVETVSVDGYIEVPYIPTFLAFREIPLVEKIFSKLTIKPDLAMFDGNGFLHPRHMGLASQASFSINIPSIGVAKTYYKIDGVDFIMPENKPGAYTDVIINNTVYGRVVRTRVDVKPIFVSVGNWIDLDTSTNIALHFINKDSRVPIPTRLADLETHKARLNIINE